MIRIQHHYNISILKSVAAAVVVVVQVEVEGAAVAALVARILYKNKNLYRARENNMKTTSISCLTRIPRKLK